jgi:hypothetical protein
LEHFVSTLEKGNPALGLPPFLDLGYQLYFASEKAENDMKDVRY